MQKQLRLAPLAAVLAALTSTAYAQQADLGVAPVTVSDTPYTFDTAEVHKIKVSVVARGLAHPFSLAFLPNGDALISERGAKLRIVHGAAAPGGKATLDPEPVAGTPEPPGIRNFGLQDVALHPQFAANKLVYFTFNKAGAEIPNSNPPGRRQASAVIMRGTWDGKAIVDAKEIFGGQWSAGASGSRLAFGNDGMLYMTTGAPFDDAAQDPASIYGKVLRLRDDGSVPDDNPFVKQAGARPEVFSLGHRDQLGLTVHRATGSVLAAEHGPNGGDEVNLILPGRNYGWPKWTYGRAYDGARMSALPVTEGIEQPLVLWVPSIAPTGLTFYTGDKIPEWRGNLFVGSARIGEIPRTGGLERIVFNEKLEELRRERLLSTLHQRIRDVREGPDGLLYVITDEDDGVLLRIEPATT